MASLSDPLVRHLVRLLLRKKTIVCSKSTRKGVPNNGIMVFLIPYCELCEQIKKLFLFLASVTRKHVPAQSQQQKPLK